jgi:hypothetical protein
MKPTIRPTNQGRTIAVVGDAYRFLEAAAGSDQPGFPGLPFELTK